ncbi:MAG TPA: dTMP kinase [Saprospiraceae bacterium]|nr:dTMP kinase [Saprospiraceae bacterium]HRG65740.1 dTMP kinase [Saprospiraceae bacterium]
MVLHPGKFIALEGIDGAGKSTLVMALVKKMEEAGLPCHATAEPTKNHIGKTIRAILGGEIEGDEKTIAALFLADRLDHLTHSSYGILSLLQGGSHVICDRYYLSSYAYHVPYVSLDWVISANALCAELKRPDITFFIDIPVEVSMKRLSASRNQLDRFENEARISQVRSNYFAAMEKVKEEENIIIIDGCKSPDEVVELLWEKIQELL